MRVIRWSARAGGPARPIGIGRWHRASGDRPVAPRFAAGLPPIPGRAAAQATSPPAPMPTWPRHQPVTLILQLVGDWPLTGRAAGGERSARARPHGSGRGRQRLRRRSHPRTWGFDCLDSWSSEGGHGDLTRSQTYYRRRTDGFCVIDRDAVFHLKQQALTQLWAGFSGDPSFIAYCRDRGEELEQFAVYCVLAEQLGTIGGSGRPSITITRDRRSRGASRSGRQDPLSAVVAVAIGSAVPAGPAGVGHDSGSADRGRSGGADAWAWQSLLAGIAPWGPCPTCSTRRDKNGKCPPLCPISCVLRLPALCANRARARCGMRADCGSIM